MTYYPPPALPQQYETLTPTYELPNVRSPANANAVAVSVSSDGGAGNGNGAGRAFLGHRRTASAHERINEE